MGMFDDIEVKYNLGEFENLKTAMPPCGFQTKSLICGMYKYILTEEGRLCWENGNDMNYTGQIRFYTHTGDKWYDFYADFDDTGQLYSLTVEYRYLQVVEPIDDPVRLL